MYSKATGCTSTKPFVSAVSVLDDATNIHSFIHPVTWHSNSFIGCRIPYDSIRFKLNLITYIFVYLTAVVVVHLTTFSFCSSFTSCNASSLAILIGRNTIRYMKIEFNRNIKSVSVFVVDIIIIILIIFHRLRQMIQGGSFKTKLLLVTYFMYCIVSRCICAG